MRTRTTIQKNAATTTTATPSTETAPAAASATPPAGAPAAAAPATAPAVGTAPLPGETTAPAVSMDELQQRVDAAEKALAQPTEKEMTPEEFAAYVDTQITASKTDTPEQAAERMKALKAAVGVAKLSFEQSGSAKIPLFHDPWQMDATTKTITTPTGVSSGTSNIMYPNTVDTAKRMLVIAKELRKEDSAIAIALPAMISKSSDAAPVAKAGEAASILEKIAGLFGVSATDDQGEYYGLSWKVSDVIYALESAARMDKALTSMAAAFGAIAPTPATAPVAAAATPPTDGTGDDEETPPGVPTSKSAVNKNASEDDDLPPIGSVTNEDGWPRDMNSGNRVSKSKKNDEVITF